MVKEETLLGVSYSSTLELVIVFSQFAAPPPVRRRNNNNKGSKTNVDVSARLCRRREKRQKCGERKGREVGEAKQTATSFRLSAQSLRVLCGET